MIGTRVTQKMMTDTALRGISTNVANSARLQEQIATGRKINRPSDNPAAATSTMRLRSENRMDTQYLSNIDFANARIAVADSALSTVIDALQEAKTIVVNAGDRALPEASRLALAAEMRTIAKTATDSYNTQWLGRPIFGGTVQGAVAINPSGTYIGNETPVNVRIGRAVEVRVDVSGTAAGADRVPALLGEIADDIAAGALDPDGLQAELDDLLTQVITAQGDIGSRGAQVDSVQAQLNLEQLDLKSRISDAEDIELPEVAIGLEASQLAYQASLGAAAKVLQVSLLDYLR